MNLFFFKLCLTPLLIAGATLIARRWGPAAGGWFVGLPLTSGPVSLFLALEHGAGFAAAAAANSLIGLCGIAVFSIVYAKSARGNAWLLSCCIGLAAYFAAMEMLSLASFGLTHICVVALIFQFAALLIVGRPDAVFAMRDSPRWDLPLRMGMAVAIVLSITGFAVALGPKWSGLLAPFPAFILIMIAFAHHQYGVAAARQLLYGVAAGAFGGIVFFCIVSFCLADLGISAGFTLAALAAFAMNGLILAFVMRGRMA